MPDKELLGAGLDLFGWSSLPQGWQFDLLGNRCTVRRGASPRPAGDPMYFGGGNIPWIKISDATKTQGRYLESTDEFVNEEGAKHSVQIPAGSLIIANSGVSLGFAVITRIDGCIHDGWLLLTDFKDLDRDYIYYCINLVTEKIRNFADGTTQPNLNTDIARRLLLPMPPLAQQRMIAQILGTLDDKIELNRRMNETLEAMARAIFKSWFVDYDPVRAKAEGRDPGLPKHIADLFPDRFEDYDLGEIPARWEVQRVADVGNILCGKTPSTTVSEYYGEDIPFITIPDMHGKMFATNVGRKLSLSGAESQKNKMLPPGAICVSCIATPGLVVITSERSQTNQQINSIVPRSTNQTYFWYWVFRALGDDIRAGGSGGSVLTNLSTGRFSELPVLAPPRDLRTSYHAVVAPFFDRVLANEKENGTLAAVRDALLAKLISGELPVNDAGRFLEGAAS